MAKVASPVTPSVVDWALREDGRPLSELADRLKIEPDLLDSWRSGTAQPSTGELTKLAALLHRPRVLFFLPEPPVAAALPSRFRHAPGDSERSVTSGARLAIRRARRVQRAVAAERAREEGGLRVDLPLVSDASPTFAADLLRRWVGVSIDEQLEWSSDAVAARGWRDALELKGVLVFQLSIGREDIRGFSAWDDLAPLIAVNTTRVWNVTSRIFTLTHELAHLARRSDSACFDYIAPDAHDPGVERWCEEFAAAFLLPEAAVRAEFARAGREASFEVARRIARRMKVSLRATALRLIDLDLAEMALYTTVDEVARTTARRGGGGGGERRPQVRLREYGRPTAESVVHATRVGWMTELDATDVLRVTVPDLREIAQMVAQE